MYYLFFFKIDTSIEKYGQRIVTNNSTNRNKKQKVRRGGEMQIKTVKAGIFSPRRLAKIKEINDRSEVQSLFRLGTLIKENVICIQNNGL